MASSISHHLPSDFEHEISIDVTPPECCNHRVENHKNNSCRKGPALIEEAEDIKKSVTKTTYGTLDSDVEDL